jgi:hypothetical protein
VAVVRRLVTGIAALAAGIATAVPATASQLIDRNATGVHLAVNAKGEALLTYRAHGRIQRILAWGAVDARHPTSGLPQVRLRKDYAGGWGKYRRDYWRTFENACHRYDGPKLDFLVTACGAPDGSYWAVQSWQTALPDLGMIPWLPVQRAWELHLSHWRGPTATLEAWSDWDYSGRFHQLFGRLTYQGQPVYGFGTTRTGVPTDSYGRLIYLDTFNSRYGNGWKRENSFVPHKPTGIWCYGFFQFDPTKYPHPKGFPTTPRGPGTGEKYRLTVNGPGVTPDMSIVVPGTHDYDPSNPADVEYERKNDALLFSMLGSDTECRHH